MQMAKNVINCTLQNLSRAAPLPEYGNGEEQITPPPPKKRPDPPAEEYLHQNATGNETVPDNKFGIPITIANNGPLI